MTNEQVIKRINEIREIFADYRELTSYDHEALDIAISALSKHCASSEQADTKLFNRGYWLMPGEVFISHNVLNEVLNTIIKSMNTEQRKIDSTLVKTAENDEAIRTDDHIADDSKMVDQFRDTTKKTTDGSDTNVPAKFKPGDKFILELGEERRMFGEFEIAGTDLYVKTSLLEKLMRYEPGENPGIIRCNACKHWIQAIGRMKGYGLGRCDFHDANLVDCNGFCYWAERRNDG